MNDLGLDDLFERLITTLETTLKEKRQHEAIIAGLLAYLFFHEKNNTPYEEASLICVRKAIDDLLAEALPEQQPDPSQQVCSFCGRGKPQVRLAAGAKGFICDSCVSLLGEVFKQQQASPA